MESTWKSTSRTGKGQFVDERHVPVLDLTIVSHSVAQAQTVVLNLSAVD